jgi:predicted aspartyl protease
VTNRPYSRDIGFSPWLKEADSIPLAIRPRNVHNIASLFAMTQYQIAKHFTIPVEINRAINLKVMLDTGATVNFIHQDLVEKHGIQMIPWQNPLTTKDIHGRILAIINEQAIFCL